MTSRLAYAVAGEIKLITVLIEEHEDPTLINEYASQYLSFLITQDQGKTLETETQKPHRTFGWEAMIKSTLIAELEKAIEEPFVVDVDFQQKWIEVRVQTKTGITNIVLPQRRLFSSTTYIFLLWVYGASIILLVIAVLFMRNQVRPIHRLALAAERFGKGRTVKQFKIEGSKEVRQAGQAFLDMKTRIKRQISQRTDMLAGVSHDLRTPITRLKLQIAMLGDSPDIYEMKKDLAEMEQMIEGYLNFVRGQGKEKSRYVKVSDLLNEVTLAAKRQGCEMILEINEINVSAFVRPTALKRCFANIIGNAAKFAESIWVTLEHNGYDEILVKIEDNGPGISEEKFDEVFRPFYRIEESRNKDTGGIGLGMPIAMDIIHAHGGEIWLEKSQDHGGLKVNITLPV